MSTDIILTSPSKYFETHILNKENFSKSNEKLRNKQLEYKEIERNSCERNNTTSLAFPEQNFLQTESTYSSSKSNSFSSVRENNNFPGTSSAFKKTNNKSSLNNFSDIFLYPTMYQALMSKSESLNLKFHQLCKNCQQNIFYVDKNNQNNHNHDCLLKAETVVSFDIKSMKKNKITKRFEVSNLKKKRKMDRDCIHKKIKARLFKYIKEKMKEYILEEFSSLKIQQKVISDVTLDFNKKLLISKLGDVFIECSLYFSTRKQIAEICKKGKEEELTCFLQKPVKECYEDYLSSESFIKDMNKFNNDNYVSAFKVYSLDFIEYYNQETNYKKYKKVSHCINNYF